MNGFLNNKRFRYGSAATAFTCAFVAVVIIFNIIFTALANKYMWYIDMTEESLFTLSEATKDLMSDVDDEINIYFASEPDELMEGTYSPYMKYIYQTARQLEDAFPNIHVECKDVVKERAFFEPFRKTAASNIYTTSVIMESGGEVRVFSYRAFFIFDEDGATIWAYNGEQKFMSGVLQLTSAEKPIVYFTAEHGESPATALQQLFYDNGFDVREIDLATEEIDEDARIIVIHNPVYDFIGASEDGSANEIAKLDAFLDRFGCLMAFADPDNAARLSNLSEFLAEWGVAFTPNTYLKDADHAISADGLSIVAQYVESEQSLGASIYSDLTDNLSTMPKTISPYTMPLQILWEEGGSLSGARMVSPVLTSYSSAHAVKDGETVGQGSYPLMTISQEVRVINNEYYRSYVIVSGSAYFTNYAYNNAYANTDILSATISAAGRDKTIADIDWKVFDDTSLVITTAEANRWTVAFLTVLPSLTVLVGIVIHIRRKHS